MKQKIHYITIYTSGKRNIFKILSKYPLSHKINIIYLLWLNICYVIDTYHHRDVNVYTDHILKLKD